jgi:Skp family chaperone for outer membrane proteins
MKKIFLFFAFISIIAQAQTAKGVKIGYIDMEYILEKVPDYADALNQLEQKAQNWKQEIETKRTALTTLKESLKTERVLLTKELIEEREEEIAYFEKEMLDYQEKRFGPKGDLIIQKSVLVKPIQDQIFTIVQDVAEQRKYDFVFDRSSD